MVVADLRASVARILHSRGIDSVDLLDDIVDAARAGQHSPPTHHAEVDALPYGWDTTHGTMDYCGMPAVVMWTDSTLVGLWSGMREMVGEERFGLALQKQGRNSVEGDWTVISTRPSFVAGFNELVRVAAAAGWGDWHLDRLEFDPPLMQVCVTGSWEARLVDHFESSTQPHFLAGKFAGYGTRLFGTNCWTDVRPIANTRDGYCFTVRPSPRSLESDLNRLLEADDATRADLAVAVQRLRSEVMERKRIADELMVANHQAEAATRLKSRFLATMSHELRTPLHGILGTLELLADADLPAGPADLADRSLDAARSLLSIVGDLLDISRIEAGELALDETEFALRRVVHGAADLLMPVAQRRGLSLDVSIDPRLDDLRVGDSGRVRQVLVNLLSNALKYTPEGGATIRVEAAPGRRVRFLVQDSGIGIPSDKMDVIFEAFRQVDDSSTRRFTGTGLGLAICAAIATRMDGTLMVHSEVGTGSTFAFTVPLPIVERPSAPVRPVTLLPKRFNARVLVVDDVNVNRTIAKVMLDSLGCTVVEAQHGGEALERLAEAPFDLVLMDVMMPVMDGLQATRSFRARGGARRDTPVIAVTANAMLGDREECLAAGMNDYLPKPVRRDVLHRCLARWLPLDAAVYDP